MASKTASNAANTVFGKCTAGSETATHFGIGTSSTGTGKLLFRKALASSVAISANIRPQFDLGDLTVTTSGDIADSWQNEILSLLFSNTGISLVGDATGLPGSTVDGSLYVSLHTADPGAGGNQTTSECAYTGYARVAVSRTSGWTVA